MDKRAKRFLQDVIPDETFLDEAEEVEPERDKLYCISAREELGMWQTELSKKEKNM